MITASYEEKEERLTLKLASDLLSSNAEQAAGSLEGALGVAPLYKKLRLDLTACRMIDSVGLNLLYSLLYRVKQQGVSPVIVVAKGNVERILAVAQMGEVFKVEVK